MLKPTTSNTGDPEVDYLVSVFRGERDRHPYLVVPRIKDDMAVIWQADVNADKVGAAIKAAGMVLDPDTNTVSNSLLAAGEKPPQPKFFLGHPYSHDAGPNFDMVGIWRLVASDRVPAQQTIASVAIGNRQKDQVVAAPAT